MEVGKKSKSTPGRGSSFTSNELIAVVDSYVGCKYTVKEWNSTVGDARYELMFTWLIQHRGSMFDPNQTLRNTSRNWCSIKTQLDNINKARRIRADYALTHLSGKSSGKKPWKDLTLRQRRAILANPSSRISAEGKTVPIACPYIPDAALDRADEVLDRATIMPPKVAEFGFIPLQQVYDADVLRHGIGSSTPATPDQGAHSQLQDVSSRFK